MSKLLQVRHVPDALHRRLKERAARRGVTLSDYVLAVLERDDREVPFDDWLAKHRKLRPTKLTVRVSDVIRGARDER